MSEYPFTVRPGPGSAIFFFEKELEPRDKVTKCEGNPGHVGELKIRAHLDPDTLEFPGLTFEGDIEKSAEVFANSLIDHFGFEDAFVRSDPDYIRIQEPDGTAFCHIIFKPKVDVTGDRVADVYTRMFLRRTGELLSEFVGSYSIVFSVPTDPDADATQGWAASPPRVVKAKLEWRTEEQDSTDPVTVAGEDLIARCREVRQKLESIDGGAGELGRAEITEFKDSGGNVTWPSACETKEEYQTAHFNGLREEEKWRVHLHLYGVGHVLSYMATARIFTRKFEEMWHSFTWLRRAKKIFDMPLKALKIPLELLEPSAGTVAEALEDERDKCELFVGNSGPEYDEPYFDPLPEPPPRDDLYVRGDLHVPGNLEVDGDLYVEGSIKMDGPFHLGLGNANRDLFVDPGDDEITIIDRKYGDVYKSFAEPEGEDATEMEMAEKIWGPAPKITCGGKEVEVVPEGTKWPDEPPEIARSRDGIMVYDQDTHVKIRARKPENIKPFTVQEDPELFSSIIGQAIKGSEVKVEIGDVSDGWASIPFDVPTIEVPHFMIRGSKVKIEELSKEESDKISKKVRKEVVDVMAERRKEGRCPHCGELGPFVNFQTVCSTHGPYSCKEEPEREFNGGDPPEED